MSKKQIEVSCPVWKLNEFNFARISGSLLCQHISMPSHIHREVVSEERHDFPEMVSLLSVTGFNAIMSEFSVPRLHNLIIMSLNNFNCFPNGGFFYKGARRGQEIIRVNIVHNLALLS